MKYYQYDMFIDFSVCDVSRNVVSEALELLSNKIKSKGAAMNSSRAVKDYCRLKLATKEHEVFGVLFLDAQHRLIEFKELFRGTIHGCNIYIREVAKEALGLNAAAVIFTHNHPSGVCEPSEADIRVTQELKKALGFFDVRVLDHIVVSTEGATSMVEMGALNCVNTV